MTDRPSVDSYMAGLSASSRRLAEKAHAAFMAEGCSAYVKTIYIGYDFDGEMVAAMYVHSKSLEVALALDEDHENDILVDASHLTWRTLPVAAVVTNTKEVSSKLRPLISEACKRVRSGEHAVNRDNDFFIEAHRLRQQRRDR